VARLRLLLVPGGTGLLVGIPAFRAAPIEFLQQLVSLLEVASYSKEDLVVLQGDPGGTLYFVAEGKLEVCVGGRGGGGKGGTVAFVLEHFALAAVVESCTVCCSAHPLKLACSHCSQQQFAQATRTTAEWAAINTAI
jgi:hypothetical protein